MRIPKIGATAGVVALAALTLSDCAEERHINQPITDSVHVQGTVRAWRCGVGDWYNNNLLEPDRLRFSVRTGESATVTFLPDSGFANTVETDDSSDFDLHLSTGTYQIVVETGYTYPPDTFDNVQLRTGDTTLVLDIVYDVLDPLNISCLFRYDSIDDTLSTNAEWGVIQGLNQRSYESGKPLPALDLSHAIPGELRQVSRNEYTSTVFVYYQLPIYRESRGMKVWNVLEAERVLRSIIAADTAGFFPDGFGLNPSGYFCLLAQQ